MSNKEKILNTIALKAQAINELKEIKEKVKNTPGDTIKFKIETICLCFSDLFGMDFIKEKSKLNISKYTMQLILKEAIRKERERINKLIDKLIKEEMHEQGER